MQDFVHQQSTVWLFVGVSGILESTGPGSKPLNSLSGRKPPLFTSDTLMAWKLRWLPKIIEQKAIVYLYRYRCIRTFLKVHFFRGVSLHFFWVKKIQDWLCYSFAPILTSPEVRIHMELLVGWGWYRGGARLGKMVVRRGEETGAPKHVTCVFYLIFGKVWMIW